MTEVAERVHRLGDRYVNWDVIEQARGRGDGRARSRPEPFAAVHIVRSGGLKIDFPAG